MLRLSVARVGLLFGALLLTACGARTGLRVPDVGPMADAMDAVDVPQTPPRTYLGTEFWAVSTLNNYIPTRVGFSFAVALRNPNPIPVMVTITGGALTTPVRVTIQPDSTVTQELPWVQALAQRSPGNGTCSLTIPEGSEFASARADNGAYRISSTAPINAYQFNPLQFRVQLGSCVQHSYTNDASLLLPTTALGTSYRVLTYRTYGSFAAIVGTSETPTRVEVDLSASLLETDTIRGTAGSTQVFTLRRGEVLELVASGDLTGSAIRSDAPIAVFTGVNCTNVSWPDDGLGACDHLEEQLFPDDTWGREVVVSQLRDRGPTERSVIRILSRDDNNQLQFLPEGVREPVTLQANRDLLFQTDRSFVVRSTAPILVAQFMEGQETTPEASMGDPAMVFEVPAAQYRRDYSFVVPATYTASFIHVTARTGAFLALDGRSIEGPPEPIGDTGWVVWRAPVRPGSHILRTTDPAGMGLKVMGIASYTSYAYPGGLDLSTMR